MSSFLYGLGRATYRHRLVTSGVWLLIIVLMGAFVGLFANTFDDKFELPGAESQEALDSMRLTFPQASGARADIIVVSANNESVDQGIYKKEIENAVERLEDVENVEGVTSPFSEFVTGNINDDKNAAIINVSYDSPVEELTDEDRETLQKQADELLSLIHI